jgi:ABC-type uncharacterized transport system substrate-binding protein
MRRREFLSAIGSAAAAWPLTARAQQRSKLPTIGLLGVATASAWSQRIGAFVQRLQELGWIEPRTVAIEYRWAEGRSERFAELAAKRLELMKELSPSLARAGVLMNPDNPAMPSILRVMEETARASNVKLQVVNVQRIDELEAAIELAKTQIEALVVVDDGLFIANAQRVAERAAKSRLPSIGFQE